VPAELLQVATLEGFPVHVWDLYHRAVAMIQNTYMMATLLVYGVHTHGFRFDKPLGLRPLALSKPEATCVYRPHSTHHVLCIVLKASQRNLQLLLDCNFYHVHKIMVKASSMIYYASLQMTGTNPSLHFHYETDDLPEFSAISNAKVCMSN